MLKKCCFLILIFLSLYAYSQETITLNFNQKSNNRTKTLYFDKENIDRFNEVMLKQNKNYYNKEAIKTLRADVKSKYGNFSIILFDYNKNGTFNDFRTIGSKIGSDGIEVCNYKSFQNSKFKASRTSIYRNHPIIINGTGFRIKNLRKSENQTYKADLVKETVNPNEIIKNHSGILNTHLSNTKLVCYNENDTLQLNSYLNNGKYLFLNNINNNYQIIKVKQALNKYKYILDFVSTHINKKKSEIGFNFQKSKKGISHYDRKSTKDNNNMYYVKNTDIQKIIELGFNNRNPNGILIDDQGKIIASNVDYVYVVDFLKHQIRKRKAPVRNDQLAVDIYYEIGEYILNKTNNAKIFAFLDTLDKSTTYSVKIVSSADYLGTDQSNHELAKNRAREIENELKTQFSKLFSNFEIVNRGGIFESNDLKAKKQKGNQQHRKTSIVCIKNSNPKKRGIIETDDKKTYIYNPIKQEFELKIGEKFILNRLIFHRGTDKIQQRSKSSLKGLLRFLKENPKVEIEIQGHLCCNAGPYQPDKSKVKPYAKGDLSSKRARFVYLYLVKNRIRSKRLTYNGYGFQNPIHYPETSKIDKSINKRVEIVITKF